MECCVCCPRQDEEGVFLTGFTVYLYVFGVLFCGLISYLALRLFIARTEKNKQKRLLRLKDVAAVPTESAILNGPLSFRAQGKQRIKARFSITRKLFYGLLLLGMLFVSVTPFLDSVSTSGITLAIAVLTVLLGIAARPFLENFVAGIVISFSTLVRVGDVVDIDDHYGTVEDITMTHTVVRRWDGIRYTVPNAIMIQKAFMNYTIYDAHRWVHVEFHVDYASDMELVQRIAESVPQHSKYYDDVEPPQFWILELDKESIKCMVVAWTTSPAYGWMLSVDIRSKLLKQFQQEGITTHSYRHKMNPA